MTQKISPFLEGKYGWEYGESGWNSGMDENLLKFSFLFDGNIDSIVSSLPAASNGKAVFLTTDNRLYFAVGTTWYSTPVPKWFQLTDRLTGKIFQFNGTSLVEVETSAELGTRVDAIELTVSTLGSAAFEESSYFATQSALEVASAQANAYTDEIVNKKGIVSVRDYITSTVDGITSNQSGIEQAVSEALARGAELYWPAGAYVSDANIPGFHSVSHVGSGVVKRGADTFKIRTAGGQENLLYVSPGGSDSNDGLSEAQPFLTIQAAVNAWAVWARQTSGNWKIKVAAGTYSAGAVIDGIRSPTELVIEGELSGSTKSSILDGGLAQASGINANSGVRIRTKNLHVRNFTSNGIAAQNGSFLTIDTCDISGCPTFGANASEFSDMNIVGACTITVPTGGRGVRYYRQSTGSICDGTNPVVVQGLGAVADGVQVRDNSYVVCNNGLTVDGFANTAIWIYKHSYLELRNSTVSNSDTGIKVDALSFLANLTGTITYTGNTKNIAYTGFSFPYGQTKNTVIGASGASSQVSSGAYDLVITNNGESGIQALTNGGIFNIDVNFLNRLSFAADNTMRYWLNGVDTYRMRTDAYIPVADNTKALGVSSNRWSVLYAGTGTINTSDERSKQHIKSIDEAALRAWGRVEYVQYKFNDAVEAKGDGARWHFGLIAQRVKEAFEAEGLNAFDYGLLCYDEWDETPAVEEQRDDEGNVVVEAEPYRPAGNRYGIRYEEALALECAYLRSKIDRL